MKKITLFVIILAFVASSTTLFLLESSLKYILYFFEATLIVMIYCSLSMNLITRLNTNGNLITKSDCAFSSISFMVLVLNLLGLKNVLSLAFAIIVSFFVPGYVLLRLLKFQSLNSWIDWPVLAFALSIGLTSLIYTFTLLFTTYRAILISAIYLGMSLSPPLKEKIDRSGKRSQIHEVRRTNEHNLFDVLFLVWISLFIIFAISSLYPQIAYIPADITRHFSLSVLLARAPDFYQSPYPWFHLTWATVYELSSSPMEVFQTGPAYLSLVVIFSFYIMARAYLKDVDRRVPILATAFFSVFSGFGWLHFLVEKVGTLDPTKQAEILKASSNVSYRDVGYGLGPWVWLWFRPMTIAIALLFTLLYLLIRKNNLPKRAFTAIFSLLIVTLGFVHLPELILFSIFLLVLSLFMPKTPEMCLKEGSLATLIGSIAYFSYACISDMLGGIVKASSMDTILILAGTSTMSLILTHKHPKQSLSDPSGNRQTRFIEVFTGAIALVFLSGILAWLSFPDMFSIREVDEIAYVPLMMYPVLLGIVVFFALDGLALAARRHKNKPIIASVFLFLITLAFGKLLSLLNAEFFATGYWERRFFIVIFAAASMMAASSFVTRASRLIHGKMKGLLATIVALIVMGGMTSTFLSLECWKLTAETSKISKYALEASEYLSSPFNRDIRTPILTVSTLSRSRAEYIPSPWVIDHLRYPVWESQYPEAPLIVLYNEYYPPPYVYLSQQDFDQLSSRYVYGYFAKHMLSLLPKTYANPEITVFRIPEGAPPTPHSKVVLIIPDDESADYLLAYYMLSLGGYDYTVCLDSDAKTITEGETIILPRDDEISAKILENLESQVEFQQEDKEIIIFNLSGYGPLANIFFEWNNLFKDTSATHIKGLGSIWNLPSEVLVSPLTERDGTKVLAWYSNEEETPFAAELIDNARRMVYINVYPIMKAGRQETVVNSRQVLNLLMSEIKGDKVKDASMNGNDGSVHGAEKVDSPFGVYLDFDGEKSFIDVPHSDKLNPTDEITIEAWVKTRTPDIGFTIVSKKASYRSLNGYSFLYDGGSFYFNFGNGTSYFPNGFWYGQLKAGQWYHLAVTYDGHYVKYFVNGAEVGSVEQSETIAANNLSLLIGKRSDGAWRLNGSIFNIVMYNETLTASEIEESYSKTMTFVKTNPMSPILGSLVKIAGVELPPHIDYEAWVVRGNTAFFRNVSLEGNVVIKTPSLADIAIKGSATVTIVTDQEQIYMTQIKDLYIKKTDCIEIHVKEAELHQGRGFYTKLTLVSPTLLLSGENALITLVTSNQKTREITFKNGELTILGQLTLYARTPDFQVNGEAKFTEMYSLFSLYRWLRSLGQDLNVHGTVEFQLTVSDVYSFASNLKWNGSVAREPPILLWNEYSSIRNMLPWLTLSILLAAFYRTFFRHKPRFHTNIKDTLLEQ